MTINESIEVYRFVEDQQIQKLNDAQLEAIATKSIKEVTYHLRWSSEWVIRLGDGTEESNRRLQEALKEQWMYTGELFTPEPYELVDVTIVKEEWEKRIESVFSEAGLEVPKSTWMQGGGKEGRHTEHLGFLLAEMQYLQRVYPNATW